jgi:hypothetical protein
VGSYCSRVSAASSSNWLLETMLLHAVKGMVYKSDDSLAEALEIV